MKMHKKQKAATLLEIAIIMPFFLMGLFFVLWIAFIVNAKNSLVSAVENGVRLASTRGKPGLYQGDSIADGLDSGAIIQLDRYNLSDDKSHLAARATASGETYESLLAYNLTPDSSGDINFEEIYGQYTNPLFGNWAGYLGESGGASLQLKDLPVFYTYAIAYANKAMRMAVGDSIRYPCKPDDPLDPNHGENCLFCYPINPLTFDNTPLGSRFSLAGSEDWTIMMRRVAIRCDYKPGGFITRPLLAMINFLGGGNQGEDKSVMSHLTYFDAYERCYFQHTSIFSRYCCEDPTGSRSYCF